MLGSKAKRELKRNQRRILIDSIEIGIPSPEQVYAWGERQLPNGKKVGEIKNSKTVNYKRFTPLRDGLFCERIFGPVNSFVCACGKRQPRADITFCDKCEVEYTDQRTRRHRLGYIPLVSPVAHIWYLKGRPSYLSLFLGKRKKKLVALAYCNAYLVEQAFCQMPRPNLALAPTDVTYSTQKREAHGVNRYTKSIQSSSAIRQISNLFYNSPKGNFHTNEKSQTSIFSHQPPIQRGSVQRENTEILSLGTTLGNAGRSRVKPPLMLQATENVFKGKSKALPLGESGFKNSSLSNFQQKIDKKTSPSRFFYLLAEVLGHIEKDVVFADSESPRENSKNREDSTDVNQETQKPYTAKTSLLNRKERDQSRPGAESLLSLHPVWGYTCFEEDLQNLRKVDSLLETTNLDPRKKKKAFANIFFDFSQFKYRGLHTFPSCSTPTLRGEIATAPTLLLSNIFAQASFLSNYSWSFQEWSRLFGNYAFYKPSFKPIQPILTIAVKFTTKKVFQADPTKHSSQLALKAVYQLPFSSIVERWLSSFLTFSEKTSKEILYFPGKNCLKVLALWFKDYKLQRSYLGREQKITLDAYRVPFSLRLISNVQKRCSRISVSLSSVTPNLGIETLTGTVTGQGYKSFSSGLPKTVDFGPTRADLTRKRSAYLKVAPETTVLDQVLNAKESKEAFNEENEGTIKFSTCHPFENQTQHTSTLEIQPKDTIENAVAIDVDWQKTTQDPYYNKNKRIKTAAQKKDTPLSARLTTTQPTSKGETSPPLIAQTPEKVLNSYNRAHTFPFLPSLVCKYNLRDDLLNFLNSSPVFEDKPIFTYCKLKRWQPLRDVHQFMSDQVISESVEEKRFTKNVNAFTNPSVENAFALNSAKDLLKDKIGVAVYKQDAFTAKKESNSAKRFLNSIAESTDKKPYNMPFEGFNSNSQKINGLALQDQEQREYASWVKRTRDSVRDANLLQTAGGVTREYTLLERLASLRHVLYMALLEKSFAFGATELATRTHKMSCLLACIAREKLLYDSVNFSRFTETELKAFNKKHKIKSYYKPANPSFVRSIGSFNDPLRGSKELAKRINATKREKNTGNASGTSPYLGEYRQLNSDVFLAGDEAASAIQSLKFSQPTWGFLRAKYENGKRTMRSSPQMNASHLSPKIKDKRSHAERSHAERSHAGSKPGNTQPLQELLMSRQLRLHTNASAPQVEIQSKHRYPFHYLLKRGVDNSPNVFTKKSSHLPTRARVIPSQKVSSLIGLANTLKFRSPERSYRSLLLDKTWLRSFLLEKNLLDKRQHPEIGVNKPLTLLTNKNSLVHNQNKLTFNRQTRSIPSQIHALRQHMKGAKQFNSFVLLIKNAWPVNKQRISFQDIQSLGKRIRSLDSSFVQQNCNVANNIVKKNIAVHEKRLINRVYNLTFLLTLGKRHKETFFACQLIPPPTKMMEAENLNVLDESGVRPPNTLLRRMEDPERETLQEFGRWKGKAWKHWEHNLIQTSDDNLLSSALSFFLVLPHSYRIQQNQTAQSVPTKTGENTNILDSFAGLQVQLKNGNSQMLNTPQNVLSAFLHHTHVSSGSLPLDRSDTSSDLSDTTQASSANKVTVSKESTARVTSGNKVASNNIWPSVALAKDGNREAGTTVQSLRRRESIPVAYRNQNILRDSYNNPDASTLEALTRFSVKNEHPAVPKPTKRSTTDSGFLQKTNVSKNSSPTLEEATQHKQDKDSLAAHSATVSRQGTAFPSLELTAIREILSYTGGGALQKLLQRFDTQLFAMFLFADVQATRTVYKQRVLQKNYPPSRAQKRILTRLCRRIYKNSRRLKITQLLTRSKRRPEWMLISVLPVLPPDLRPILQMSESVVVASDLNNLYQRVVYRNNRFYKLSFVDFHLVTAIQRLVQDAVDRLIENGKGGSKPFYTPGGRPLRSLSDTLKGKKGRFRLNLLGKRVDFSGRSVIVVSPSFKVHECGLPREIALELYHYFLLRELMLRKHASSIIMAKKIIQQRNAFVWDVLRDIVYHHPVLLNRAPTLHRLGIQAFQPKLVKGNAILLHPLVCSGFNADFDGDQMGVHLPLSTQARAEAWDLLWSRNNLLSPATGQPVLVPSQDMVLGFYYMTQSLSSRSLLTINHTKKDFPLGNKEALWKGVACTDRVFLGCPELVQAFQNKKIDLHTPVWLQWQGNVENDEGGEKPLELRINGFGSSTHVYSKYKRRKDESLSKSTVYIKTTAGRVLVNSILFSL